MPATRIPVLAALALGALLAVPAEGQGLLDRAKKRAKTRTKQKVEQQVDRTTDKAVDGAFSLGEDAVKCAVGDDKCAERAEQDGKSVVYVDKEGKPASAASAQRPGQGAWANYDFVPGERILFEDDLSADNVGDFPRRWDLQFGNTEIVEWQGLRFLRATDNRAIVGIPLPETLPERFTIEFDFFAEESQGNVVVVTGPTKPTRGGLAFDFGSKHDMLLMKYRGAGFVSAGHSSGMGRDQRKAVTDVSATEAPDGKSRVVRFRIMADGKYVKAFVNERRVANVPNANLGRSKVVWLGMGSSDDLPTMIGNVRIAAGGRDLYDALSEQGRVAVQGIFFDTGSDRLRPESTPTLTQIGEMLKAHGDLRLGIEGHTDNVGKSEANRVLSQKRAAAVKKHLVDTFGIAADRLTTEGFGDAKPAASNDTPEGRQQNRRVELVKK